MSNKDSGGDDFEAQISGERTGLAREFYDFLRENKKWWLAPIVISARDPPGAASRRRRLPATHV